MKPESIPLWVESAFYSMREEPPEDFDFAVGVALHWMLAGKIGRMDQWEELMGLTGGPDAEILNFQTPPVQGLPVSFDSPEARTKFMKLAKVG